MTFYIFLVGAFFIYSCSSLSNNVDATSSPTASITTLTDFSMVKSRTSWRNKFYVYVGNTSELLYHLETYCPNWENQGPEGILETGTEFLESSWSSFTNTMTVKYNGMTRKIYYPSAGSWKGYFGSAFLLDENQTIVAYVPWKWSLYKFQVVSQNGNVLANADRDYFGNPVWYIKFTSQGSSKNTTSLTAVDVAVMTFLYEFTRDTTQLSDGIDGCTNFILVWVPVLVGIVLAIFCFCIFCLYCRHRCCAEHTSEEVIPLKDAASKPLTPTESSQVTDVARKLGLFSRPGYDNV